MQLKMDARICLQAFNYSTSHVEEPISLVNMHLLIIIFLLYTLLGCVDWEESESKSTEVRVRVKRKLKLGREREIKNRGGQFKKGSGRKMWGKVLKCLFANASLNCGDLKDFFLCTLHRPILKVTVHAICIGKN